jgi:hypothetical protein
MAACRDADAPLNTAERDSGRSDEQSVIWSTSACALGERVEKSPYRRCHYRYGQETGNLTRGVQLMRAIFGPLVIVACLAGLWLYFSPGKPSGISDARYSQFERMPPPKILYSCTRKPTRESLLPQIRDCARTGRAGCEEEVSESAAARAETTVYFVGGTGDSTYSELLQNARRDCSAESGTMGRGEFKILESSKK